MHLGTPRILCIGLLREGGTSRARMQAMLSLGCRVEQFDMGAYLRSASRPAAELGWRFASGPAVRRINADLLAAASRFGAMDYVWVDKGLWIHPETLAAVRAATGGLLIHYTPDPQVTFQRLKSRLFLPSIPLYDVLFTTKRFELEAYRQHGARDVRLVHQSYDDGVLLPRRLSESERARFRSEVCFVGQHTDHYARLLRAVARSGARLRIWGPRWRATLWRNRWARGSFCGDGVWGEDYTGALGGADIALCLLSKRYPETTTTRTFEIPACGTFMLAERTDDHCALFEEGNEAEFFADEAELLDKLGYYLRHAGVRERIAAAGRARCLRDGHGNRARVQAMLASLRRQPALPIAQEA